MIGGVVDAAVGIAGDDDPGGDEAPGILRRVGEHRQRRRMSKPSRCTASCAGARSTVVGGCGEPMARAMNSRMSRKSQPNAASQLPRLERKLPITAMSKPTTLSNRIAASSSSKPFMIQAISSRGLAGGHMRAAALAQPCGAAPSESAYREHRHSTWSFLGRMVARHICEDRGRSASRAAAWRACRRLAQHSGTAARTCGMMVVGSICRADRLGHLAQKRS